MSPRPLPAPNPRNRRLPQNPLTVVVPTGSRGRKRPPDPRRHQPPAGSRGRKRPPAPTTRTGRPVVDSCLMTLLLMPVLIPWLALRALFPAARR